ncbi:aldo/keto reductase [Alkalinema sp. FACHB-956]|uniref:aldo/keto reductase n=1 Tax=Alkalinema sp. FACHB-956 TaxID=2692768 RepID=UPI001685A605|nr:aldo/keto reductase [Alkalinema sp. FACHB-956]MBD2327313.1 aldo/keto reductase [Alkalinema sp. FACHB-956]
MQYRRFGRTQLKMPVFSCGGMRYQYKWNDVPAQEIPAENQRNVEQTVRRSLELGINHIETARAYGTSEVQLGQVLPLIPRDQFILQTKILVQELGQSFLDTFEQSLASLNVDYVDLLAIHGLNSASHLEDCLKPGGCLEMARSLQAQGKARFIGFSTHAPTEVIIQAIETDAFDYVNLHWYYINQNNWPAIEAATRHDMGVFIISPSDKGGKLYAPPKKLTDLCAPLSPIVFNNLFCLSHPQIHTLSIGAAKPSDFDEHLKTLPLLDRATEILEPILQGLEQAAIETLGADWWQRWSIGLPTVDQTPGGLNIPVILWLRNLALAYDMTDYAKMRYNLLGQASHWFPGSRVDRVDPEGLKPLLANSPFADRIPQLLRETHDLLAGEEVQRLSQAD